MSSGARSSVAEICGSCAARRDHLCGELCDDTLAQLAATGRAVDLPANAPVCGEGGGCGVLTILRRGFLRQQRFTRDGRRQITAFFGPGEIVGDGPCCTAGDSIETATPSALCRFPRAEFDRLVARLPDLRRAVYRQHLDQLDRLRLQTWSLGTLTPEERLCAILAMATRAMPFQTGDGPGGTLTMELSRADLADFLGTTPETISRLTHRLDAEGLIRIVDPRHFRIPDLPRLAAKGCLGDDFGGDAGLAA